MKNSGLRNRFPSSVRTVWLHFYDCMICGFNCIDTLHHIVSPPVWYYIDGKHNESVFNSAPLHNYTHPSARELARQGYGGYGVDRACHVGNEGYLNSVEGSRRLLNKTAQALHDMGYQLLPIDRDFLTVYNKQYDEGTLKLFGVQKLH